MCRTVSANSRRLWKILAATKDWVLQCHIPEGKGFWTRALASSFVLGSQLRIVFLSILSVHSTRYFLSPVFTITLSQKPSSYYPHLQMRKLSLRVIKSLLGWEGILNKSLKQISMGYFRYIFFSFMLWKDKLETTFVIILRWGKIKINSK